MDYAVIKTGGKQYRVAPGEVIDVEKVSAEVGGTVEFTDVLLVSQDGTLSVGAPLVPDARVVGEVQEQGRDKKVVVFKFKSKTRQRKKTGHRQPFTRLIVKEIVVGETPQKATRAKTTRRRSRATKEEASDGS